MILACDPGKVSGICHGTPGKFSGFEIPYPDIYGWLEELIDTTGPDVVVCENFIISGQTSKKNNGLLWSVRIIGVLDYLCMSRGIELVLQTPSEAKNFVTDKRLKEHNCYFKGEGHSRDAARHALLYYYKNYPKEIIE